MNPAGPQRGVGPDPQLAAVQSAMQGQRTFDDSMEGTAFVANGLLILRAPARQSTDHCI